MDVNGWRWLGAYRGEGWFQADWEARPWWERTAPEQLERLRAWEADPEPLPPGEYCAECGEPAEHYCTHVALTGHNQLGRSDGRTRRVVGPLICCNNCERPSGPVSGMWERVHSGGRAS
jgi:hypothetical protein